MENNSNLYTKAQLEGARLCGQMERLMDVCDIHEEDRQEAVFCLDDDFIYVDFKCYDLDFNRVQQLWGLIALICAEIQTDTVKGTNKYRGFIEFNLKFPIQN